MNTLFVAATSASAVGGGCMEQAVASVTPTLADVLSNNERFREKYWRSRPTSAARLYRRAVTARQLLHVLPGETVLEIGAGSGLWTQYLDQVFRGETRIVAAVANADLAVAAARNTYRNTVVVDAASLHTFEPESFDHVVASNIAGPGELPVLLETCRRLLRPGGKLLCFEANHASPTVWWQDTVRVLRNTLGLTPGPYAGLRAGSVAGALQQAGFVAAAIFPFDCVLRRMPRKASHIAAELAHFIEHAPGLQNVCGTLALLATREGEAACRRRPNLADHPEFFGAVSVVVLCRNEELNVERICRVMFGMYGPYIHELLIVDDNSSDRTADIATALAAEYASIRVLRRSMPNGVGRALRDGCSAATGRYVLTMDCDFSETAPEVRSLFDKMAEGHDGAIGSRFSPHSVLVGYPYLKMVCNRVAHALLRTLTWKSIHDISNNLKLYRTEVFREMTIRSDHFGANLETGFRPLLSGFDIVEVPVSWINRDDTMGKSSFRLLSVGPEYLSAFIALSIEHLRNVWSAKRRTTPQQAGDTNDRAV